MSAPGINPEEMTRVPRNVGKGSLAQGLLFITPSLVITVISYILFALLSDLTPEQLNTLAITITSAIILSLVGTAGMQILIYRIIDEGTYARDLSATGRGIRLGTIYSIVFSILTSALMYFYFQNILHLPMVSFIHFSLLLTFYSLTWVFITAFWARNEYQYPAIIFTFSYLVVLSLGYGFYQLNADSTITGYTTGVAVLLLMSAFALRRTIGKRQKTHGIKPDLSAVPRLISRNLPAIFFHIFYILAIFLDKIIVWVAQGMASGKGLLVTSPYTTGAFLGLIPMFSVLAVALFTSRVKLLIDDMYQGTLEEIRQKTVRYRHLYQNGLGTMMVIGLALFVLVTGFTYYFMSDTQVVKIEITIALGSLFFMVIVYDAVVLPLFGRTSVSMLAMLIVCLGEALSVFFVARDAWFAAAGFLAGSFVGSSVSHSVTRRLPSAFEYNLFRLLILAA